MKTSNSPNLFLVGAPKCGTTTLTHWLEFTGKVFVPVGREPHYFAEDIIPDRVCNSPERYAHLYRNAPTSVAYRLDGSTGYLASAHAVPDIVSGYPHAKFIVAVRDPAEMVPSLHRERLNSGFETIENPRHAWQRCIDPQDGKSRPPALDYRFQCNLSAQVARVSGLVSPDRLLVLSLKEISVEPQRSFDMLMNFLNLSTATAPDFGVHGAAFSRRSLLLQRLLHLALRARARLNIPSLNIGLSRKLDRMNRKPLDRVGEDDFVKELKIELKDQREGLSELLSHRTCRILDNAL